MQGTLSGFIETASTNQFVISGSNLTDNSVHNNVLLARAANDNYVSTTDVSATSSSGGGGFYADFSTSYAGIGFSSNSMYENDTVNGVVNVGGGAPPPMAAACFC